MTGLFSCSFSSKSLFMKWNRINRAPIALLRYWTHLLGILYITQIHTNSTVPLMCPLNELPHSELSIQGAGWRSQLRCPWHEREGDCPLECKGCAAETFLFHCFSSCLCCNADSIQFMWCLACVSPGQSVQRLSSTQTQPSATLPVWLSRPLRNRCPLFFFFFTIAL